MEKEKLLSYIDYLVNWIKDYVNSAHADGVILGLSGGIDSAVCAYLLKKAMGDNLMCLILPCFSNPIDEEYAMKVVNDLNLRHAVINLDDIYTAFKKNEDKLNLGKQVVLAEANTKVRIRMVTLYQIGQTLNYLVCGTDNLAEEFTGYFTKYGDGGVDFLPLAKLTKGEVFEMARILGVPQEIIDRKPTAGLVKDVNDEDELGVTYEEIDKYLLGGIVSPHAKETLERLHRVSEHKRIMPPQPKEPNR